MTYLLLIAAFMLMGSAGGWAGQEVWSPIAGALALVLGLAVAAYFAYRRQEIDPAARPWLLAPVRGALLAVALWVAGTALWSLNDVLLPSNLDGGAELLAKKSLLGTGLGVAVGAIFAIFRRRPRRRWLSWLRLLALSAAGAALLAAAILFVLRCGVRDPALYPPRESSPYKLPWPGGVVRVCGQGNWGILTHRGNYPYAFDFPMPIGSEVCAARDGTVMSVIDTNDGNANPLLGADINSVEGNGVTVRHDDGTWAIYYHIRKGGSKVRKEDRVRQGQVIADSGNVGFSTSPHLHFEVHDQMWQSMPISFADVDSGGGIPRMWRRYRSGNYFNPATP